MNFRRYTLGLLVLMLLLLVATAAFNRVIDPFWYYRDIEITGLNAVKPRFARFERHVKPALLQREAPQAVILGSSFFEIGFDPLDRSFTDGGRLKGYNFAFAGTHTDDALCALEYAAAHAPIKRVVMGIVAGAQPQADCAKVWRGMTATPAQLLLSTDALDNAIRTVTEQHRARPSHTREGRYLYARGVPGAARRFSEYFARLDYTASCGRDRYATVKAVEPQPIEPLQGLDMSGLRAALRLARTHGIELKLVVYTRHALAQELEFVCSESLTRWRAIEALARVVAEESPDGSAALWVFDDYNALMGERVTGGEPVYWQDPAHFNYELGTRMMAAMFGGDHVAPGNPGGFGMKIMPGGAGAAYAALLRHRAQYLAQSPWFYDDLRALAAPR